jgi:hypothetical protein
MTWQAAPLRDITGHRASSANLSRPHLHRCKIKELGNKHMVPALNDLLQGNLYVENEMHDENPEST